MDEEKQHQRKMTAKGLQYTMDFKRSEQNKLLRRIKVQSEYLERLIESDCELSSAKIEPADWLNNYEQFLVTHSENQQLLNETELDEDNELFETFLQYLTELKETVVNFVSQKSKVPIEKDNSKSVHSSVTRSSTNSKVSSMLSAARLKESQRKAELMAKAETLAKKQKLEEEKLKLQQKEEAYMIKTELKISNAKAKAIEELERRSMIEDQNVEDMMNVVPDIEKQ